MALACTGQAGPAGHWSWIVVEASKASVLGASQVSSTSYTTRHSKKLAGTNTACPTLTCTQVVPMCCQRQSPGTAVHRLPHLSQCACCTPLGHAHHVLRAHGHPSSTSTHTPSLHASCTDKGVQFLLQTDVLLLVGITPPFKISCVRTSQSHPHHCNNAVEPWPCCPA
jgi:hypothetical protein